MKRAIVVFLVLASLIGGAAWYGFSREGSAAGPRPETAEKLALAEQFLNRGETGRALEVIRELESDGARLGEKGELTHLRALQASGDHARASALAQEFLQQYPESRHRRDAEVVRLSSELAISGLANPTLRQAVEQFVRDNPSHSDTVKLQTALAHQDLEMGDYRAAQRRLEQAKQHVRDMGEVYELARALGEANLARLLSSSLNEGDQSYTVQSGDTINGIARRHGVTEELLMQCNNVTDPRLLRIGQRLKIPNVDFSLEVDIAANTLTLKNHGQLFKVYRVRTGREAGSTPTGEFRILNKKVNPTWRPGNGYAYPPGDPNNELGTRWMAFQGDLYGIHGTVRPETVGHYSSNGCVGMTKEDVEELFDLITVGTPLAIHGQQDLTRHKVIPAADIPPPRELAGR